jgi:tRNA modification GTPase
LTNTDTIVALATAQGVSAIAVIRLSGEKSIELVASVFHGKDLAKQPSHTIHFGTIRDGERVVDEVLVSIFKNENSFTKENSVEISCHGSPYIIKEIIKVLLAKGARLAGPGEFTKRAFLNGRFDLAQAEAVADLINA